MHVDRESLAEKSLSQAFPASNVGVMFVNEFNLNKMVWCKGL